MFSKFTGRKSKKQFPLKNKKPVEDQTEAAMTAANYIKYNVTDDFAVTQNFFCVKNKVDTK